MNLNKASTKLTPVGASGSHMTTKGLMKPLVWGSTPTHMLSFQCWVIRTGFCPDFKWIPAWEQWERSAGLVDLVDRIPSYKKKGSTKL